jgi:hypothetical protein
VGSARAYNGPPSETRHSLRPRSSRTPRTTEIITVEDDDE